MVKALRILVVILAIVTLMATSIFLIVISKEFHFLGPGEISWENTSQVSDFFGGVVGTLLSAMGFILIYLSFKSQTESQNDQKNQFLKSQIETRFIELIKIHKDNVGNLNYERESNLRGQKVIDLVVNQFESCFKEIDVFFELADPTAYYQPVFLQKINDVLSSRSIDAVALAQIDISYSIVFFGLAVDDLDGLKKLLSAHYNETLIENILDFIKLKCIGEDNIAKWDIILKSNLSSQKITSIITEYRTTGQIKKTQFDEKYQEAFEALLRKEKSNKFYGGHQYKLGHYFRHLFLTVKYINDQTIINYPDKYNYIKMLRAQISTIEQYLIFYNSLSFMGRAWELDNVKTQSTESDKNKWLFTKYNFIKNTPNLVQLEVLKLNEFYPELQFEFHDDPSGREELKKIFK